MQAPNALNISIPCCHTTVYMQLKHGTLTQRECRIDSNAIPSPVAKGRVVAACNQDNDNVRSFHSTGQQEPRSNPAFYLFINNKYYAATTDNSTPPAKQLFAFIAAYIYFNCNFAFVALRLHVVAKYSKVFPWGFPLY